MSFTCTNDFSDPHPVHGYSFSPLITATLYYFRGKDILLDVIKYHDDCHGVTVVKEGKGQIFTLTF
jgi:hypothetical protein